MLEFQYINEFKIIFATALIHESRDNVGWFAERRLNIS
jgi:hypothetical protein